MRALCGLLTSWDFSFLLWQGILGQYTGSQQRCYTWGGKLLDAESNAGRMATGKV